jgi:type I restriction enzyme S subunit
MTIRHEATDLLVQIPDLPRPWEIVALGECLQLISNGTTAVQEREPPGHPVSRIQTLTDSGIDRLRVHYIRELTEQARQTYQLRLGDLLLSHINSEPQLGRTAVYEGYPPGLIHGMNLLRLRVDSRLLDPHFLHYLLMWYRMCGVFVRLAGRAVGQSSVNQGKLKTMKIVRPPLPEQQAIAHVLRTVQRARETAEQVISAARELKRSLMHYLFTYGPVQTGSAQRVSLIDSKCGYIPMHWLVSNLESIAVGGKQGVQGGPFGSRLTTRDYTSTGVPIIRGNNLSGSGTFQARGFAFVSHAKATDLSRHQATAGDLVVTQRGTLGQVGIIPIDGPYDRYIVSQSQMKATIDPDRAVTRYVYYFMQTRQALRQIGDHTVKSGVPHINLSTFRSFLVPLPPIGEQQRVADALEAADQKIIAEEQRRDALDLLFKSLLHDLMSARLLVPAHLIERVA